MTDWTGASQGPNGKEERIIDGKGVIFFFLSITHTIEMANPVHCSHLAS